MSTTLRTPELPQAERVAKSRSAQLCTVPVKVTSLPLTATAMVYKTVDEVLAATTVADVKAARDARREKGKMPLVAEQVIRFLTPDQKNDLLQELRKEMENAAKDLDFERAASLRDEIARLEGITLPAQKQRR